MQLLLCQQLTNGLIQPVKAWEGPSGRCCSNRTTALGHRVQCMEKQNPPWVEIEGGSVGALKNPACDVCSVIHQVNKTASNDRLLQEALLTWIPRALQASRSPLPTTTPATQRMLFCCKSEGSHRSQCSQHIPSQSGPSVGIPHLSESLCWAQPGELDWLSWSPRAGPVENRSVASEVWLLEFLNLLKWMGSGQTPGRNVEGKADLLPSPEKGSFLTLTPAQITVHHTSHQGALPAQIQSKVPPLQPLYSTLLFLVGVTKKSPSDP